MRAHVADCELCAARVAELERLCALMHGCRIPAPDGLPERILDLVESAIPVRRLSCREAQELSSAYLDAELNELDRETLEAHLFACETCFAAHVQMRTACEALRAASPVAATEGLKERILAAVAADGADAEPVIGYITPPMPQAAPWRRVAASVAAIAAIALLGLGVFQMNTAQEREMVQVAATAPDAEAPVAEAASQAPETAPAAPLPSVEAVAAVEPAAAAAELAPAVPPAPREATTPRPSLDVAPEPPVRPAPAARPSRPAPVPVERRAPARPAVGEAPALARHIEAPDRTHDRSAVGLASVDRTPARGPRPTSPRVDAPLPTPPPPDALTPSGPARGIATAPALTRPEPMIAAPQPAPDAPRVATTTPAPKDTAEGLRAARDGAGGDFAPRTRLYTGPGDVSADLAERAAIINAQAAAERERTARD